MFSSTVTTKESISIYTSQILDLAEMCNRVLISGRLSNDNNDGQLTLFDEYKQIIREKNIVRQFIMNIEYQNSFLGCIDPRYRRGKPLKFQLYTRETILVMFNGFTNSNVINHMPDFVDCKSFPTNHLHPSRIRVEKFELLPPNVTQIQTWHFVNRPCIEWNFVDTFSVLYHFFRNAFNNTQQLKNHNQ